MPGRPRGLRLQCGPCGVRLTNLSRLDIRLGLMALTWNRQDRRDHYREILLAHLRDKPRPQRLWRRHLDGQFYDPCWVRAS